MALRREAKSREAHETWLWNLITKFGPVWTGWFGKRLFALRLKCIIKPSYRFRMDAGTGIPDQTNQHLSERHIRLWRGKNCLISMSSLIHGCGRGLIRNRNETGIILRRGIVYQTSNQTRMVPWLCMFFPDIGWCHVDQDSNIGVSNKATYRVEYR